MRSEIEAARYLRAHSRNDVVTLTRAWLGTPYHHQASLKGSGCDCLGLVRGVWRELYGFDAEPTPAYSRDWAEADGTESLLAGAARNLTAIDRLDAEPGDVVVFRLRAGVAAKHTAILSSPTSFIHAMEGVAVCEVSLSPWWRRRIAGAFTFPGTII